MNRFDEAAKDWDSRPDIVERNKIIGEELCRRIPFSKDMQILDYGAGTGLISLFLADRVGNVTAADTSQGMLDVLTEKLTKTGIHNVTPTLIGEDIGALLDGSYDCIFTGMTLHHVENAGTVLRDFRKLTAGDGWIAIADLVAEDGSFHGERPDVHHHGFSEDALSADLNELGYVDITSSHVHAMTRSRDGVTRQFPVFLLTGRLQTA